MLGFFEELSERFSEKDAETIWESFNDLFTYFALAALVNKQILCMHGGISDALTSLDDIRKVYILV